MLLSHAPRRVPDPLVISERVPHAPRPLRDLGPVEFRNGVEDRDRHLKLPLKTPIAQRSNGTSCRPFATASCFSLCCSWPAPEPLIIQQSDVSQQKDEVVYQKFRNIPTGSLRGNPSLGSNLPQPDIKVCFFYITTHVSRSELCL
jgi:hypothetical protein